MSRNKLVTDRNEQNEMALAIIRNGSVDLLEIDHSLPRYLHFLDEGNNFNRQ